jgi:hypothetical protein
MDIPLDGSATRPAVWQKTPVRRFKKRRRAFRWLCLGLGLGLLGGGVVWLVASIRKAQDAAAAERNFRRVTLAFLDCAEKNGGVLPARAIYDKKTGKPLLSWRVAILPQLGEAGLYEQVRLDEPWDSPHNQQLWGRMPEAYELPGLPSSTGMTAIQVFTGPETSFRGREGRKHPEGFPDGSSNTILVAESATPVNWMQPEDIDIADLNAADIRARLGDRTGKGPLIGLADGSTRFIPKATNKILKAAITPDAGDLVGPS